MHSLDWLRGEMIARGCTKQQAEGKGVAIALDILTNAGGKIIEIQEEENVLSEKLEHLRRSYNEYRRLRDEARDMKEHLSQESERLKEFETELLSCESAAERDRVRKAQFFLKSFKVDSKYDNTAKINGLAAILSSNTRESQGEDDDAS